MEAFAADACDEACSICLESFTAQDPATVTTCKHEYHLQCILEWSQRSRECPICWQTFALSDPVSQELLAAVGIERKTRTRHRFSDAPTVHPTPMEDYEFHNALSEADDSDVEERTLHQFAAATSMRQASYRREGHGSNRLRDSQLLVFGAPSDSSNAQQLSLPTDNRRSRVSAAPEGNSLLSITHFTNDEVPLESPSSSQMIVESDTADNRRAHFSPRIFNNQTPPGSPNNLRNFQSPSFSESLRSKLSAASSRYKETLSKSTQGFKEKLLSRNNSMKELSKEVKREVTAGVARMMERLDPSSKRTKDTVPLSSCSEGTSEMPLDGTTRDKILVSRSLYVSDGTAEPIISSNVSHRSPGILSPSPSFTGAAYI